MRRKTYLRLCAEIHAATQLALVPREAQANVLERKIKPLLQRINTPQGDKEQTFYDHIVQAFPQSRGLTTICRTYSGR